MIRNAPVIRPRLGLLLLTALLLAWAAGPASASAPRRPSGASSALGARPPAKGTSASASKGLITNALIFVVITAVGAYACYFGLFLWLLRKSHPCWPLDAWRRATYLAWIIACAALYVFNAQIISLIDPWVRGLPSGRSWITPILQLVLALIGLLVIWNFRRETADRPQHA